MHWFNNRITPIYTKIKMKPENIAIKANSRYLQTLSSVLLRSASGSLSPLPPQELQGGSSDPVWLLCAPVPYGLPGPASHCHAHWEMDVSQPRRAHGGEWLVFEPFLEPITTDYSIFSLFVFCNMSHFSSNISTS